MTPSVTFLLDNLCIGGAELHTLNLARHLSAEGARTSLVVFSEQRSKAIRNEDLPSRTTILGRGSMNADPAGWRLAGKAIASYQPRVVIAVNQASFSVAAIAKLSRWHDAPLLCLFHTFLVQTRRDRLRLPVFKSLLSAADGLVFVSENQRSYWQSQRLRTRRDSLIRNGVDLDVFAPTTPEVRQKRRRELGFTDRDFVIGVVAQFRPEKNQALLLDAAAVLKSQGVPVKLLFVGGGSTREIVQNKAAAMGLIGDATFVGEQRDVRPFLTTMDAAVLCSSTETMPLAALEALACAVPVVLPDVGGSSEIVRPAENGHLYPGGDFRSLAARLIELWTASDRQRFRDAARTSAVERFDQRRMFENYSELISRY